MEDAGDDSIELVPRLAVQLATLLSHALEIPSVDSRQDLRQVGEFDLVVGHLRDAVRTLTGLELNSQLIDEFATIEALAAHCMVRQRTTDLLVESAPPAVSGAPQGQTLPLVAPNVQRFRDWDHVVSGLKSEGAASRSVIVYGFPGSGSTLMWQVLEYLVGGVKKTASCPAYRENRHLVATVRDFRDVLCTYLKRTGMTVDKASIDMLVKTIAQDEGVFSELYLVDKVWRSVAGRSLWLRYEDCFDNFPYICDQLAIFLERPVTAPERLEIERRFNFRANARRMQAAKALTRVDMSKGWLESERDSYVVDGINAKNITSDGTPGKWRRIIPEELHAHVTNILQEPLAKFGYL